MANFAKMLMTRTVL